ncbi:hypothetical protein SUNI508_11932 [Seiridium unicorne]|uniref:Uncharacterized protein n=1 Tax=Seiridium unicorne TaxID=138068 RepID=A0ABR2UFY4_9PEZI
MSGVHEQCSTPPVSFLPLPRPSYGLREVKLVEIPCSDRRRIPPVIVQIIAMLLPLAMPLPLQSATPRLLMAHGLLVNGQRAQPPRGVGVDIVQRGAGVRVCGPRLELKFVFSVRISLRRAKRHDHRFDNVQIASMRKGRCICPLPPSKLLATVGAAN